MTLIIVPAQTKTGGVYNFYQNLKVHLPANYEFYYLNRRKRFGNKIRQTIIHFNRVRKIFNSSGIDRVILNPSLNLNAVLRDSFFVLLAIIFKVEIVVFWRGWDFRNEKYLKFPYRIITFLLLKANKTVVLYSKIEDSLRHMGYRGNILLMTTMVNNKIFNYKIRDNNEDFHLIFLSRVEIYKGIYELIEAYGLLKLKYPKMKLTIAGNGHELENVVKHIEMNNYIDIIISGYLTGDAKYELLASGNLFVFPSYSEGMPNAVLEGMAVGLPIVTTKVGGLNDFFENGIMGSYIEIKNVNSIVKEISHLYENQELRNTISKYNIKFAFEKFNASTVAKKYLSI